LNYALRKCSAEKVIDMKYHVVKFK